MLATDILRGEHRVIEQVLDCLVKLAEDCAAKRKLDGAAARQIIDFFQTFAGECHHRKEEERLFRLLESKGRPRRFGPTTLLRKEHDLGRRFLLVLTGAVDGACRGEPDDVQRFVGHALAYARMMRELIKKEDQRLFPMMNETLSDEEQRALLDAFEEVEHHELLTGTHEKCLRLADALADRMGVEHVVTAAVVAPKSYVTPAAMC
jgi:hemerythrin-like domain-containing protein